MPLGWYARDQGRVMEGNVVFLDRSAVELPFDFPDHVVLLKRVASIGPCRVCRSGAHMAIDGEAIAAVITSWEQHAWLDDGECIDVGAGLAVVIGDHELSFDSRYFGPVSIESLRRARKL